MPKISVIVPVYKAERYLRKCIESILAQTCADLELLLIDDGSPDGCPKICDIYAANDPRVRVIHKENGGVSSARNAGLDAAVGDYIAFVDSDDYIEPDMYEKMLAVARNFDCDVVMCDCVKDFADQSEVYSHNIRSGFYDSQQLKKEYFPHLLMMENVEYPATISNCTILWRNRLNTIDQRYQPGVRFSEDLLFGAKLLRKANSFYYMKGDALYHYVQNGSSASHTYVPDKWNDYLLLHSRIADEFKDDSQFDFTHQIDLCLLFFLYNTVGEIFGTDLSVREKKDKISETLLTPEVVSMFDRLRIGELPITSNLKLLTWLYKYRIGLSVLAAYYGGKRSGCDA